jgi:1-deoxy-D-xylulose-5-phosphate reductoisomerase
VIRLAILGSTGSIGESTLEVVRRHPDRFRIVALSARRSGETLARQVREFDPAAAVLADPSGLERWEGVGKGTEWRGGREEVVELAARGDVDVVVNAVVGAAGLEPTLVALRGGKRLALANKESLVAGGELVLDAAREGGGELIPVDSEHSAILQCLRGADRGSVARLVLTASGGPFRGWSRERLAGVGPDEALEHPTWSMGAKITIDSASLANKALEVIEAHFLYGIGYDGIDAVVHPQSIVHSFVEFVDGSVLAQVGEPTMELPILYALTHPHRVRDGRLQGYDPVTSSPLTFEAIDHDAFPHFGLGVEAGRRGGVAPAVFNAANEVAVEAFLDRRVGFLEMADRVAHVLDAVGGGVPRGLDDVLAADEEARRRMRESLHEGTRRGHSGMTGATEPAREEPAPANHGKGAARSARETDRA